MLYVPYAEKQAYFEAPLLGFLSSSAWTLKMNVKCDLENPRDHWGAVGHCHVYIYALTCMLWKGGHAASWLSQAY